MSQTREEIQDGSLTMIIVEKDPSTGEIMATHENPDAPKGQIIKLDNWIIYSKYEDRYTDGKNRWLIRHEHTQPIASGNRILLRFGFDRIYCAYCDEDAPKDVLVTWEFINAPSNG